MLIPHPCRQSAGSVKHWFSDTDNDLFVWLDMDEQICAFQYSYHKSAAEHILSWSLHNGYNHGRIDDGENVYLKIKMCPIILPDGDAESVQIADNFLRISSALEPQLVDFIYRKLLAYCPSSTKPTT